MESFNYLQLLEKKRMINFESRTAASGSMLQHVLKAINFQPLSPKTLFHHSTTPLLCILGICNLRTAQMNNHYKIKCTYVSTMYNGCTVRETF